MIYLDTHLVAWLYAGRTDLLPQRVRRLLNEEEPLISPMVTLELQYLFEIGRTAEPAMPVVEALRESIGLEVCDLSFAQVVARSLSEDWTRDPFDRLIVSQAAVRASRLLTKDATIQQNYSEAVW